MRRTERSFDGLARFIGIVVLLFVWIEACAPTSPLTVVCLPERPVAHPGESVGVRAWAVNVSGKALTRPPRWTWSASIGTVEGTDAAIWALGSPVLGSTGALRATAKVVVEDQVLGQGECELQLLVSEPLVVDKTGYEQVIQIAEKLLETVERERGPTHPETAASLNNLAQLYYAMGSYGKAESLYQRALAIHEKALGPTHPDMAASLNNLANLYQATGAYAMAEPLLQRALTIHEKALGPDHPDTAQSLSNLAALYEATGDYAKAEPLLQRALAIREKALGPTHPDTAPSVVDKRGGDRSLGLSGRALWLRTSSVPKGYGLYSYLFFGTRPRDNLERERYLKSLEAYLRVLHPIEEFEGYTRQSELNITLVPVNRNVELPHDLSIPKQASQAAERVLAAYDYARASVVLASLGKQLQSGPFLVSLRPTVSNPGTLFLFFDMSHVTPRLVGDWVRAFCSLAAQERSWSEIELTRLALNIRNILAVAAKTTPEVLSALEQWIQVGNAREGQ